MQISGSNFVDPYQVDWLLKQLEDPSTNMDETLTSLEELGVYRETAIKRAAGSLKAYLNKADFTPPILEERLALLQLLNTHKDSDNLIQRRSDDLLALVQNKNDAQANRLLNEILVWAKSLKLVPNDVGVGTYAQTTDAMVNLAWDLRNAKNDPDGTYILVAEKLLQAALTRNPEDKVAWNRLSQVYKKGTEKGVFSESDAEEFVIEGSNRTKDTRSCIHAALKIDDKFKPALYNLTCYYTQPEDGCLQEACWNKLMNLASTPKDKIFFLTLALEDNDLLKLAADQDFVNQLKDIIRANESLLTEKPAAKDEAAMAAYDRMIRVMEKYKILDKI